MSSSSDELPSIPDEYQNQQSKSTITQMVSESVWLSLEDVRAFNQSKSSVCADKSLLGISR